MLDCKPIGTPLDMNSKLSKSMSPTTKEEKEDIRHKEGALSKCCR